MKLRCISTFDLKASESLRAQRKISNFTCVKIIAGAIIDSKKATGSLESEI